MARRRQVLWASVVGALLLAVGSAFAEGGFRKYWKLSLDVQQLKDRNHKLSDDNAKLRREVEALRTDTRAIERAAREELGFVRPGETVFTLEAP